MQMTSPAARDIPIFWGHGKDDPVVHYHCMCIHLAGSTETDMIVGERSIDLLTRQLGFATVPAGKTFARPGIRFESYDNMGHSSSPEEIRDLTAWLTEALK